MTHYRVKSRPVISNMQVLYAAWQDCTVKFVLYLNARYQFAYMQQLNTQSRKNHNKKVKNETSSDHWHRHSIKHRQQR